MPAATESGFEVAFWFLDHALNHNEYLQPQKLHRLLFLAQAYYAVAYSGRKLFPGMFVAANEGPIEPTVYKAFTRGRPNVEVDLFMPQPTEMFLESIWRRFGHHSVAHLDKVCKNNEAYVAARKRGERAEITVEAMRAAFEQPKSDNLPNVHQVMRPKIMRSQTGEPVAVRNWMPGVKPTSR